MYMFRNILTLGGARGGSWEVLGEAPEAILGPFRTILRTIWGQVKGFWGNLLPPAAPRADPCNNLARGGAWGGS